MKPRKTQYFVSLAPFNIVPENINGYWYYGRKLGWFKDDETGKHVGKAHTNIHICFNNRSALRCMKNLARAIERNGETGTVYIVRYAMGGRSKRGTRKRYFRKEWIWDVKPDLPKS